MSRGILIRKGIPVGSYRVPDGTKAVEKPAPKVPLEAYHQRPDERADGLARDVTAEGYARKRWSPRRWNPFRSRMAEVAEFDDQVERLEQPARTRSRRRRRSASSSPAPKRPTGSGSPTGSRAGS